MASEILETNETTAADGTENMTDMLLEEIGKRLNKLSWWSISVLLHVALLLMLMLIGLSTVMVDEITEQPTIRFVENVEEPYEPEAIEKSLTEIKIEKEIEDIEADPTIEEPDLDFTINTDDTDDPKEKSLQGSENAYSDIQAGDWGCVGFIGVGPGGLKGKFGRPDGGSDRLRRAKTSGGGKETEYAVDAALNWLARHAESDGHWDSVKNGGTTASHDSAQTGLALLAFLSAGHTEKAGLHKKTVVSAVEWIRDGQNENGSYADGWGYNHAICGLAMAEAAGMANVRKTERSAQRAVDYSTQIHQIGEGSNRSGWRYAPKAPEGDISVSGWFIMQLKSAKVSNLKVPYESYAGVTNFLDSVEVVENPADSYTAHRYKYMANPDNPSQHTPTAMRTAIGVLCRQFMGTPRDDLDGAVEFMLNKGGVPTWGAGGENVDWYYWYYGSMVAFQARGAAWTQWNEAMRETLCPKQIVGGDDDGSWDPTGRYASEGRVFSTAMGALCLEVYYRYLPLYR